VRSLASARHCRPHGDRRRGSYPPTRGARARAGSSPRWPCGGAAGGRISAAGEIAADARLAVAILPLPDDVRVPPPVDRARRAPWRISIRRRRWGRSQPAAIARRLPSCFVEDSAGLGVCGGQHRALSGQRSSSHAWHLPDELQRGGRAPPEAGTQAPRVQPAATTGSTRAHPSEAHETAVTDVFYTWGWDGRHGARAEPVSMDGAEDSRARGTGRTIRRGGHPDRDDLDVELPPAAQNRGPENLARLHRTPARFLLALPARGCRAARCGRTGGMGWETPKRLDAARRPGRETWKGVRGRCCAARTLVWITFRPRSPTEIDANGPPVLFGTRRTRRSRIGGEA